MPVSSNIKHEACLDPLSYHAALCCTVNLIMMSPNGNISEHFQSVFAGEAKALFLPVSRGLGWLLTTLLENREYGKQVTHTLPPQSPASLRPLLKTESGCTTFHQLPSPRDVFCGSCSWQQACRRCFGVDEQCEGCAVLTELRREALGVTSLQSTSHPEARGLCSCPIPPARGRIRKEQALASGAGHHWLPQEQLLPPEAQHQVVFNALRGLVRASHRLPARALLPASAEGIPTSHLLSTTKSVLRPIPTGLK